jgi:hypothetical protein
MDFIIETDQLEESVEIVRKVARKIRGSAAKIVAAFEDELGLITV